MDSEGSIGKIFTFCFAHSNSQLTACSSLPNNKLTILRAERKIKSILGLKLVPKLWSDKRSANVNPSNLETIIVKDILMIAFGIVEPDGKKAYDTIADGLFNCQILSKWFIANNISLNFIITE